MGFPSAWAIFVQDWCRLRLRAFALVDDQENEGDGQQAAGTQIACNPHARMVNAPAIAPAANAPIRPA
jgi:hypothetical protein